MCVIYVLVNISLTLQRVAFVIVTGLRIVHLIALGIVTGFQSVQIHVYVSFVFISLFGWWTMDDNSGGGGVCCLCWLVGCIHGVHDFGCAFILVAVMLLPQFVCAFLLVVSHKQPLLLIILSLLRAVSFAFRWRPFFLLFCSSFCLSYLIY